MELRPTSRVSLCASNWFRISSFYFCENDKPTPSGWILTTPLPSQSGQYAERTQWLCAFASALFWDGPRDVWVRLTHNANSSAIVAVDVGDCRTINCMIIRRSCPSHGQCQFPIRIPFFSLEIAQLVSQRLRLGYSKVLYSILLLAFPIFPQKDALLLPYSICGHTCCACRTGTCNGPIGSQRLASPHRHTWRCPRSAREWWSCHW